MRKFLLFLSLLAIPVMAAVPELPVPTEKAIRYYRSGVMWWSFSLIWNLIIPWIFLSTGASARLRRWAFSKSGNWYAAFVIYLTGFLLYVFAMELPLSFAAGYLREHQFGLSEQLFSKWIGDYGKGFVITLIMSALTLWVPYLLIKKQPRRWWWITGLAAVPYLFFVMLIQPIWIAPLFNDFGRMQNHELESKILELAHRAGIDADRVYEVNKSVDTKHLNAYVTGVAGTKRIVLWDTLLKRLDEKAVLSVMGHEMGHFALNHVRWGITITAVLIFFGLYLMHVGGKWVLQRWGRRWGLTEMSDFATLPLAIFLLHLVGFVLSPIGLAYSRHVEHEADRFALEITHDNEAFMRVESTFVENDLAYPYPHPIVKFLRSSHPPVGERFDFGRDYRPWEKGEPEKYSEYFK